MISEFIKKLQEIFYLLQSLLILDEIEGVQFHPESIMTEEGKKILANFIRQVREK